MAKRNNILYKIVMCFTVMVLATAGICNAAPGYDDWDKRTDRTLRRKPENYLIVNPTDDVNTAYTWLKSSDRNGLMGALSASNKRALILLPATHNQATTRIIFDTDDVDAFAIDSNPSNTTISGDTGGFVVTQTCNRTSLSNFYIYQTGTANTDCAFVINCTSGNNTDSVYRNMKFDGGYGSSISIGKGVFGYTNIDGYWENCTCGTFAWRLAANKNLSATMVYCTAGESSYVGDWGGASLTGTLRHCTGGDYSFSGCTQTGNTITGTLEDCVAGNRSYALGRVCSGTFRRCIGGVSCFGGYWTLGQAGTFSGYAEDCVASGRSFGSGTTSCVNSGEMVRCTVTAMTVPIYCTSATITDSRLVLTTTNQNCLMLKDSGTVVTGSTLIVVQGGTGIPVSAAAAQSVNVSNSSMNNATNDPDGMGANVTNTGTGNTVSDGVI